MRLRLLDRFRETFEGKVYRHRSSTTGDHIAGEFYEDLYGLGRSPSYKQRVDDGVCVTNKKNKTTGIKARRGDAVFGELVPNVPRLQVEGYKVGRGPLATLEIGIETKILAKAMIKQIDRVIGDATRQAEIFRRHGNSPICIGIVAINFANQYVSYEKDRVFRTDGAAFPHPCQEAAEAERRVMAEVAPKFDHFILVKFRASNEDPYPFEWQNYERLSQEYAAILTRASIDYNNRFR